MLTYATGALHTPGQQLMYLPHFPLLLLPLHRIHVALHTHHLAQIIRQPRIRRLHRSVDVGPEMGIQFQHPLARQTLLLRASGGGVVAVGELTEVPGVEFLFTGGEDGRFDDGDVEVGHCVCGCAGLLIVLTSSDRFFRSTLLRCSRCSDLLSRDTKEIGDLFEFSNKIVWREVQRKAPCICPDAALKIEHFVQTGLSKKLEAVEQWDNGLAGTKRQDSLPTSFVHCLQLGGGP